MREPLVVTTERKSGGIRETLRTLVYALLIALVVRTFLFEPFNIPSGSMKPTLLIGDYLFVSKFAYGYSRYSLPFGRPPFPGRIFERLPERGDVVVFKTPADNRTDYIKRVVGLPGDRIQIRDGVLRINGVASKNERIGDFVDDRFDISHGVCSAAEREEAGDRVLPMFRETLPDGRSNPILDTPPLGFYDTKFYDVPAGHIFVMGDNRENSTDSRFDSVGFVPLENVVGRAEFLFFSANGCARLWEPWTWPAAVRYDRLFRPIR